MLYINMYVVSYPILNVLNPHFRTTIHREVISGRHSGSHVSLSPSLLIPRCKTGTYIRKCFVHLFLSRVHVAHRVSFISRYMRSSWGVVVGSCSHGPLLCVQPLLGVCFGWSQDLAFHSISDSHWSDSGGARTLNFTLSHLVVTS